MVPPVMNRVRGKSKEARIRDHKRMNKGNLKAAGKTKLKVLSTPGLSKKKIKKKEQRARLLGHTKDKMEE